MFYERNTQEYWLDAKDLGGLDEWEKEQPKVKQIVWELYNAFSILRAEASEKQIIKRLDIENQVKNLNYETDKAVFVIKEADAHYLKLWAEKIRRMNKK